MGITPQIAEFIHLPDMDVDGRCAQLGCAIPARAQVTAVTADGATTYNVCAVHYVIFQTLCAVFQHHGLDSLALHAVTAMTLDANGLLETMVAAGVPPDDIGVALAHDEAIR